MSEISTAATETSTGARKRIGGYANYVFFVLFCVSVLNNLDRYVLSGAANVVAKELHLGINDIGYLSSAFIIFFTLAVVPLGLWADRAKRKNVVAVSVAIWSLATAFTALASNFITLFLSRMVLGIGEAGYSPSGAALISDYYSRSKRAKVMSWWATSALVGLMFGIILGGVVAGLYPGAWRLAFVFTGIPGLLLALVSWRLREPRRNQADEEEGEVEAFNAGGREAQEASLSLIASKSMWSQCMRLLRIKTLVVLIAMQTFTFFVLSGTLTYLPTFLQQKDGLGMSSAEAGIFTGVGIVLAGFVGLLLGGYLSDLLNRRFAGARILICGISYCLCAPFFAASILVAIGSHNLLLYCVFFAITTILLNINTGPSGAATQDVVPASLRASAVAVSLFIGHVLGDTFAPALLGNIALSYDPSGQHFLHNVAGHDMAMALLLSAPLALVIAGVIGILGARWMKGDIEAAQLADQAAREAASEISVQG